MSENARLIELVLEKQLAFDTILKLLLKLNYTAQIVFLYQPYQMPHQQPLRHQAFFMLSCFIIVYSIMAEQQNLSEFNRYLSNNRDLLIQKHREYFNSADNLTLETLQIPTFIKYIYDIFCFDKYKSQEKTNNKIVSSLTKNIQDFIINNPLRHKETYTPDITIQILKYCIENNDMFHVQYDIDKNQQDASIQNKKAEQAGLSVQVVHQINEEPKSQEEKKPENGIDKQIEGIRLRQKAKKQLQPNQFDQNPEIMHFNSNNDLVKKNARLAFLSFCKNQMELGGKKTFDILSSEANTMTIGKLQVYAKAYNILTVNITRQLLMRRFKKISDGKRAIDFDKFYILMSQLRDIEPDLFHRLNFYDEDLYKKLKFVKYPFYTQDQNPRELVPYRAFANKLTEHSGKTKEDLKQDLLDKKHIQLERIKSMQRANNRDDNQSNHKGKLLSPKDLSSRIRSHDYSIDLSFIDKIVAPDDNDHKFLGEYEIDHYNRRGQDTTVINNSAILKRKESIVDNIRKRIQQIERGQSEMSRAGLKQNYNRRYQLH